MLLKSRPPNDDAVDVAWPKIEEDCVLVVTAFVEESITFEAKLVCACVPKLLGVELLPKMDNESAAVFGD